MQKTKYIAVSLLIILGCSLQTESSIESRKIQNLKTFARIYGLVKYFHPSDEASEINWNKFATYGVSKVLHSKTDEELIMELRNIFKPIAPSVTFSKVKNDSLELPHFGSFNEDEHKLTFWQHLGVGLGMKSDYRSPYASIRVNSPVKRREFRNYGVLFHSIEAKNFRNKKIRLKMFARLADTTKVSAYMRLVSFNSDGGSDLEKKDINVNTWKHYELVYKTSEFVDSIEVGVALKGNTSLFVDAIKLEYWDGTIWKTIPVKNSDFEQGKLSVSLASSKWPVRGEGYSSEISRDNPFEGRNSARLFRKEIRQEVGKKLFDSVPLIGDLVNEKIGDSIFCVVPRVLYRNENGTFPRVDSLNFERIQMELDKMGNKSTDLHVRLGNIITTYSVFQHFYPYMDVVDVDWEKELGLALSKSFIDSTANDHYITLEKFTAPLKDGHIYVNFPGISEIYSPRITWEWIEDKLFITNVLDDEIPLKVGDVITHIDGFGSKEYFSKIEDRISAGTQGWMDYKAKRKGLLGDYGKKMTITVNGAHISLDRFGLAYNEPSRQSAHERISDSIYYLNLSIIEMDTITGLLPKLMEAKAIICDLRGYPNRNHMFLSHLLKEKDTSGSWMQIPRIIYPNRKNIVGFEKHGWFLSPRAPYLGDKRIVFITDGSAISYAESFMGFIEGYNLATIIGQPTAGTNGNINTFELEGGFSITWTGMLVLKHDGSQHHAIGVTPDLYLSKSIEGVRAGRDEFLEKAIELVK